MGLLRDVHPLVADIIDGKHDDILDALVQAANHRRKTAASKSGIVRGAHVRLVDDPRNGQWAGRLGKVEKINQKSISVTLACEACGQFDDVPDGVPWEDRCKVCHGIPSSSGLRVPSASSLEVIR